jgi:endonuclease I
MESARACTRLFILLAVLVQHCVVALPSYYSGIDPAATNDDLKNQLHALISIKTTLAYESVWEAFKTVDQHLAGYPCDPQDASKIPDIYSSYCWSPVTGLPSGGECGSQSATKEGECYNREHSWPNSWFGGNISDAYTDLFLLYPSDGLVNNKRGNLPLGDVDPSAISYKSTNGCLIGTCADSAPDYTGQCFELADNLKGDIARSYFYISVAYLNKFTCCEEPAVSYWAIKPWEEAILRKWHDQDPVDDTERARNEVVYTSFQFNRNPFIDNPSWVAAISDF